MSKFIQYVEDVMLVESCVSELNEEQILELHEELQTIEEVLGLGKIADKLKKFSDKSDEKIEDTKKKVKETTEKAKDVAKGIAKEVGGKIATDTKEVLQSHKEIAQSLASRFAKISSTAKEGLKKMFANIKDANEDQKKVLADLAEIIEKIENNKTVSGLKMLAAAMTMGPSGEIPSYKKYVKQLEALRTIPMFSTYKVSMKKI